MLTRHHVHISGSEDHTLKVWNVNGTNLSTIRPTGWISQRPNSMHALAFHPNMMMLASSNLDGNITVSGFEPAATTQTSKVIAL